MSHCDCLTVLAAVINAPAGATFTSEDGVLKEIPPPGAKSHFVFDPSVSPFPFWEPV